MAVISGESMPWAVTASGTINLVELIRIEEENKILRNAIQLGVPREYVLKMIRQGADDYYAASLQRQLDEYKDTGLTPDQIREIDELYRAKCREVDRLQADIEEAKRMLTERMISAQPETDEATLIMEAPKAEPEEPAAEAEATPEQAEPVDKKKSDDPKPTKRRMIDVGKVLALRNAGWSIKAIAEEMGFNEGSINQVIHRHKMKQEAANEGI